MASSTLILGSRGFLGKHLLESGRGSLKSLEIQIISDSKDLENFENELISSLAAESGANLVNCLGSRSGSEDEMRLINAEVPAILARVCDELDVRLIHLASAAELAKPLDVNTCLIEADLASALLYGQTKLEGTEACLMSKSALVLRVFNVHGLEHQPSSGLHALCLRIRALSSGERPGKFVDTVRDYVHWETVVRAIEDGISSPEVSGLNEVCSGFGVSIGEVVAVLPDQICSRLTERMEVAKLIGPVIGSPRDFESNSDRKVALIETLATEVLTCASS